MFIDLYSIDLACKYVKAGLVCASLKRPKRAYQQHIQDDQGRR